MPRNPVILVRWHHQRVWRQQSHIYSDQFRRSTPIRLDNAFTMISVSARYRKTAGSFESGFPQFMVGPLKQVW